VEFSREIGRPLVATGDVHYLGREDYDHHQALLCVQTKSTLESPKLTFDTNEFYLRSSEEMAESFAEWPEALASTLEIAERCDVEIELGKQLIPRYETPAGQPEAEYLRSSWTRACGCATAIPSRRRRASAPTTSCGVIEDMGFNAYFLIVWDFVASPRRTASPSGRGAARPPARSSPTAWPSRTSTRCATTCSSSASSIPSACRCRHRHRLLGPRPRARDPLRDRQVRGRPRGQIVTFGKMFPRAATRDAARVLGLEYAAGDRLAKLIPDPIMGRPPSFEDCLKPGEPLRAAVDEDPQSARIVDLAKGWRGSCATRRSTPPAVVIADRPLTDIVPLQLADAGAGRTARRSTARSPSSR
jgi:DNA polymerase-3 subunit alpha